MSSEATEKNTLPATDHYHRTSEGVLVTCYHKCKTALSDWGFWIGMTVGFPIEHFLWEKIWPFNLITGWMGL